MQRNSSRFKTPRICKIHRKDALLFFGVASSLNETIKCEAQKKRAEDESHNRPSNSKRIDCWTAENQIIG